ncbi:MAG TPA: hypothetical protein VGF98_05500 [Candidatus Tumulicola sp.]|jgi:tetratricopeptide (TPR) repeat protein
MNWSVKCDRNQEVEMPRANITRSIRAATQHLFRNLDHPEELQRNPITKGYFDTQSTKDTHSANNALVRIRTAIRAAAVECEREDLSTGRVQRARRNRLLFEQFYARRETYRVAASKLGLSVQQYYRDKARLCLRITAIISKAGSSPRPVVQVASDLANARLGVAEQRFWIGDFAGALRLCEDIAVRASASAKIRALCIAAAVHRECGSPLQARSSLDDAAVLLNFPSQLDALEAALARCEIKVGLARLTFDGPHSAEALEIAQDALNDAPAAALVLDPSRTAVIVESLMECSAQYEVVGNFNRSKTLAMRALECASALPASSPLKSYAVRLECRHQWIAPDVSERNDIARRIDAYREALELARNSKSLSSIVLAVADLMTVNSMVGNAEEALAYSKQASSLSKDFGGHYLEGWVRLSVAAALLNTPLWPHVGTLLIGLNDRFTERSHHWIFFRILLAEYFAKSGRLKASLKVAGAAQPIASATGLTRLDGALQCLIASGADAIGDKPLAQERIRACIDIQEHSGSRMDVYNAYKAAASIMSDSRYAKEARDLRDEIAR